MEPKSCYKQVMEFLDEHHTEWFRAKEISEIIDRKFNTVAVAIRQAVYDNQIEVNKVRDRGYTQHFYRRTQQSTWMSFVDSL